jgi:hypothetical protein
MNYIIIEAQTQNNATAVVTPIPVYGDRVEAEAVFLEKCAYARRSGLPCHSVTLLDQEGAIVARKCFKA